LLDFWPPRPYQQSPNTSPCLRSSQLRCCPTSQHLQYQCSWCYSWLHHITWFFARPLLFCVEWIWSSRTHWIEQVEPMHLDEANFNFDQCVHVNNYHRLQMMLASKMSLQFNNHLSYQISFYIEILYCIINNYIDHQHHGEAFWPCSGVGVACLNVDVGKCSLFGGGGCKLNELKGSCIWFYCNCMPAVNSWYQCQPGIIDTSSSPKATNY